MQKRALPFAFALSVALAPALNLRAQDTAPTARKEKAVMWFALRGYERVEQRVREFAQLAQAPGMDEMLLGLVKMRLKGLGGVDKARPVVAAFPSLNTAGGPRFVLRIPCSDRNGLVETVRAVCPDMDEARGVLHFHGDVGEAFGRFDAGNGALTLSPSENDLDDVDPAVPADLFPAQGGADLAWRVDIDQARRQEGSGWKAVEKEFVAGVQHEMEKGDSESKTDAERALRHALIELGASAWGHVLDDASSIELRLTLANDGWSVETEARAHADSPTAAFLARQSARTSPAAALLPAKAPFRFLFGFQNTDDVRKAAQDLLAKGRKAAEAELAGEKDLTDAARAAKADAIAKGFPLLERWMGLPEVELAFSVAGAAKQPELLVWAPFPDAAKALEMILDIAEASAKAEAGSGGKVERNADTHAGAAIHRLKLPPDRGGKGPEFRTGFLAGQDNWLVFQAGDTADPLKRFLDRLREGTRAAPANPALMRVEMSFADLFALGLAGDAAGNPGGRAFLEKVAKNGGDASIAADWTAHKSGMTIRISLSGGFVKALAEAIGDQVRKQMRRGAPGQPPEDQ